MHSLRPHHLIDIIRNIGQNRPVVSHPYGHAQHLITLRILNHPSSDVRFIIGADDLCRPCSHLMKDGLCDDILSQSEDKVSKQQYNDALDRRIAQYLGLNEGTIMRLDDFLDLIERKITGLIPICIHPKEDLNSRLDGLLKGIERLRHRTGHALSD